jgi:PAS domain S-box-containing protein
MAGKKKDASARKIKPVAKGKSATAKAPQKTKKRTTSGSVKDDTVFRVIFDNSPIGIELFDADGYLVNINRSGLANFGVSDIEALKGFSFFEDPMFSEEMKKRLLEGETIRYEAAFDFDQARELGLFKTEKTGTIFLDMLFAPISTKKDEPISGYLGQVQDVTERKKAEEALHKANEELERRVEERTAELRKTESQSREIFQSASDAFWLWALNKDGMPNRLIDVNDRATEMLGYSKEELLTMTPGDFVAPEYKIKMAPIVKEIQTKGKATYEMLHIRKDGKKLPVEVSSHTFYLGSGKVTLSVVRDITERKKAEEALHKANKELERRVEERTVELKKSKENYQQLFNSGQDYIMVHGYRSDHPSNFFEVNEKACEVLGYTREELMNMNPLDIDSPDSKTDVPAVIKQLMETGQALFEQTHKARDGRNIPVEINTHIIDYKGDKIALSICRDITERKQAEDDIRAALREKEVLLQEIHHRVKNNMSIMSALLQLQARHSKDESINRVFKDSQNRIKSMALVHEKLYQTQNFISISLKEYVDELVKHLIHTYKEDTANLGYELYIDDIFFNIDTMIPCGLIINELVTNSIKHAFEDIERPELSIALSMDDGRATLVYSDNGIGLAENIDLSDSETLGLQIVNMLTDQLEGEIESERNGGTKFIIRFLLPEHQ